MNFETYERQKRIEYAELAEAIATILTAAIRAQPSLRLQQVQHRPKDPVSLRKKLEKMGAIESNSIEDEIKDLAGARVVLYTNADVSRFLNSGIVTANFDIDWDRTKVYHPKPDASDASAFFISNNYVVKLNDQRASLPEYARFREMWCEVQVQTSLNHAWSEMAHDTIYKKPKLQGFGGALMRSIEERMTTIIRDFLIPAGYEFQKVADDFERLSTGRELFDRGALKALTACIDNNARYDLLRRFLRYVLPHYDDARSVYSEIQSALISAVQQARETPVRAIDTPFGMLHGHTAEDVLYVSADIIERFRYVDIDATFDLIGELFPGAGTDKERKRLLDLTAKIAQYELSVWNQVGPGVQHLLVSRVGRFDVEKLVLFRPVAIGVLREVLRPDVRGTSSTYNRITLQIGAVVPNEMLANARSSAIEILKRLFLHSISDTERREVVNVLSEATRTPSQASYGNELLKMVLDNATEIVEFYVEIASNQGFELLQEMEEDLLWLYRRNREITDDPMIVPARARLDEQILAFRGRINSNREYVVYKVLVGYQSVFEPAWEDMEFDFSKKEKFREQQVSKLVEQVNEESAEWWLNMLHRCARTESKDLATFPTFGRFLEELGASKSEILLAYLDRMDDQLARFLPAMLRGLARGPAEAVALNKLDGWIKDGRYLQPVMSHLRWADIIDPERLERALEAAVKVEDDIAVLTSVAASAVYHNRIAGGLITRTFLPAIIYLKSKEDSRWVNAIWMHQRHSTLLADLSAEQVDLVLASLVVHPQVDDHMEDVLVILAKNWPEKMVDFFGSRLELEKKSDVLDKYEAIPHGFHKLHDILGSIPDYLVESGRRWSEQDESLFTYRGGRLIFNVFPNFSPDLEQSLKTTLHIGTKSAAKLVVKILHSYDGQPSVHGICKDIIDMLPVGDQLLDEVELVLNGTGVVEGEFGLVEAYTRKREELESWFDDPREAVRTFAERHRRTLDRMIAAEQRRSEEELELRKRTYGEGEIE